MNFQTILVHLVNAPNLPRISILDIKFIPNFELLPRASSPCFNFHWPLVSKEFNFNHEHIAVLNCMCVGRDQCPLIIPFDLTALNPQPSVSR